MATIMDRFFGVFLVLVNLFVRDVTILAASSSSFTLPRYFFHPTEFVTSVKILPFLVR